MGLLQLDRPSYADKREKRRRFEENEAFRQRQEEQIRLEELAAEQARCNRLREFTAKIINQSITQEEQIFILSNIKTWQNILIKYDKIAIKSFIDCASLFTVHPNINKAFTDIVPRLKLSTFSFDADLVTRAQLLSFLELAQLNVQWENTNDRCVNTKFIDKLSEFLNKLHDNELSSDAILCLKRIVDDFQLGLLGEGSEMDHIMVNQLLSTITLSQLNPKPSTSTHTTNVHAGNFEEYKSTLILRLSSIPLNQAYKKTMHEVIIPGITALVRDEDKIIAHVTEQHGVLYYLDDNDKIPIHTDHAVADKPEEYRQTLKRLLNQFFYASEVAHSKGRLNEFCAQICSGYCLEGRTMKAFEWVATLTELTSFDDLINRYVNQEYMPYTKIMTDDPNKDMLLADPIIEFIMLRHSQSMCVPHPIYANSGKVTVKGVKQYLADVLALVSEREKVIATERSKQLKITLQHEVRTWRMFSTQTDKNEKISALNTLLQYIEEDKYTLQCAATMTKNKHPLAMRGFWSRTKKLLDDIETMNEHHCALGV